MTHDPLCPNAKGCSHDCGDCLCLDNAFCQCDLIATVRADERQAEANRRAERFGVWHDYDPGLP